MSSSISWIEQAGKTTASDLSMDHGQNFGFLRKAGKGQRFVSMSDTAHSHHPRLGSEPHSKCSDAFDWDFLNKLKPEANNSATSPNKRQQLGTPTESGESQLAMVPPPPPPLHRLNQNNPHVKTPRPDITAGLRLSCIIGPLVAHGISEFKASRFLQALQQRQILCSDPTQQAHSVCFPLLLLKESCTQPASQFSSLKTKRASPELL